jgi:hypothetical protein
MKERRGNVYENKGSGLENAGRNGNVIENKSSYAQNAGMFLKTQGVIGSTARRAGPAVRPANLNGGRPFQRLGCGQEQQFQLTAREFFAEPDATGHSIFYPPIRLRALPLPAKPDNLYLRQIAFRSI